jgi:hypothetical protein
MFCIPFAILLGAASKTSGGEGLWSAGLRMQGVVDFEPGQDLFEGPEIGYSEFGWFGHSLQLRAAYLTNRMEAAFRLGVPREDYFLFSPTWHFRRKDFFDPIIQADLGYMRYDIEDDRFADLNNSSWVASLQAGFALNLFHGEYALYYHFGYNFITPDSGGLLYPGEFGIGIWKLL